MNIIKKIRDNYLFISLQNNEISPKKVKLLTNNFLRLGHI
jgi:hypothetical protein